MVQSVLHKKLLSVLKLKKTSKPRNGAQMYATELRRERMREEEKF